MIQTTSFTNSLNLCGLLSDFQLSFLQDLIEIAYVCKIGTQGKYEKPTPHSIWCLD